jgi:hypothetical protein
MVEMTGRTYSIIRSSRKGQKTIETVLETGLTWELADSRRNAIAAAYREANPRKSSWSGDLFNVQMEPLATPALNLCHCRACSAP